MGQISLRTLTIGLPNATEDPDIVDNFTILQTLVNGNIDTNNLAASAGITLAQLAAVVQQAVHTSGDIRATAKAAADTGWLVCDGAAVSRTTYSALFAAISTTYGAGDRSTTFNVPDLRGSVPVGVDGAAGRLSANDALGNSGGAETHSHGAGSYAAPSHTHSIAGEPNVNAGAFQGGAINVDRPANNHAHGGATGGPSASAVTGSSATVSNMPPYQVVTYVIKT